MLETKLQTIADYIRYSYSQMNKAELCFGHGFDNAWDESVYLVLATLDLPWDFDQSFWQCRVTELEAEQLETNIKTRVGDHKPTAYIVNSTWFAGLPFYVDERVLVPRSPIAELIDNGFQPWLLQEPQKIMDLCCGSGCIGIASAHCFDDADVSLVDISEDALAVSETNIAKHQLQERVSCFKSDVFSGLGELHHESYDLIVSNPPYVDKHDVESMPDEFHHEPMLGLAAGDDGLDIVKTILKEAGRYLRPNGVLIVELGNSWPALEELYPETSFTWLEFEYGGHGVFVMTAEELKAREW